MHDKSFREMAFPNHTQTAYSTSIAGGISKGELTAMLLYVFYDCEDAEGAIEHSMEFWNAIDNATELPKIKEPVQP